MKVFLTGANQDSPTMTEMARGFLYEGTMRSHGLWVRQAYDVMWFAALSLGS